VAKLTITPEKRISIIKGMDKIVFILRKNNYPVKLFYKGKDFLE